MPQKEPLPQNGGTTPPAPEIAQSGRLLMHVLRLHRKARVGFLKIYCFRAPRLLRPLIRRLFGKKAKEV